MPDVARVSPTMIRMVVDFPAPLGPRNPVTRPGWAVKLTSSTAVKSPYVLVTDSMVIMGWFLRGWGAGCVREAAGPCGPGRRWSGVDVGGGAMPAVTGRA